MWMSDAAARASIAHRTITPRAGRATFNGVDVEPRTQTCR
jgi:hypothetical protein